MTPDARRTSPFVEATLAGTVLQLGMVVAGHFSAPMAALFPLLGVTISFAAGALYAFRARTQGMGGAAAGGALVGGLCAFLGIVVSLLLGDVAAWVLAFGTGSSALTGALGGTLGRRLAARRTALAS